jgi:hypothetical protein
VPTDRQASSAPRDSADRTQCELPADSRLKAEANDPIEPIDPAEPMLRIDPADPMDRIDPADPMDRIDPAEPGELHLLLMASFCRLGLQPNRRPRKIW